MKQRFVIGLSPPCGTNRVRVNRFEAILEVTTCDQDVCRF